MTMYRNGRRAFGDIVIGHDEGIAVNADAAEAGGYDMQQDQFADIVFPTEEGVVVPHAGGIVTNSEGSEAYDMQQTEFADEIEARSYDQPVGHSPRTQLVRVTPLGDEISGGDDGLGWGAARRLRARIRGKRVGIGGSQVVTYPTVFRYGTGDTLYDPYGFGRFRLRLPRFIRKFQFGRFLGRTALPLAVGGGAGLLFARKGLPFLKGLLKGGGGGQPGTDSGAPPDVSVPSISPTVPSAIIPAVTPSIPSAPVATDSAGGALPPDILAALRGAVSPTGGREAATASEQVATAAEQAGGGQETGTDQGPAMEAGLGAGNMGMLLVGGLGLVVLATMFGGKKRGRRR